MYASAWRSFQAWTQARGNLSFPAAPPVVAAYLAHLAEERQMSVATIRLHKAALAAIHKANGHPDPTDNEGVRRIMQGIARAHGKGQKQARPSTAEALAAVKATPGGAAPWETGNARNRRNGPPGGPGWTWHCWPPCGTGYCAGRKRQR